MDIFLYRKKQNKDHSDGLVQDFSNSIANALELLQSCTKTSLCLHFENKNPILKYQNQTAHLCQ